MGIDDIKRKEITTLSDHLKIKNLREDTREELMKAKTILQDQLRTKDIKKKFEEQRKEEAHLVAKGKKPYYAKKSVIKDKVKEKKYDELQRKGQLEKWMAKKSKKKASKQRKFMPRRRIHNE